MERLGPEGRRRNARRSILWAGVGIVLLLAGMGLGALLRPGPWSVLTVTTGFLALVLCCHRAFTLWNLDGFVFEDTPRIPFATGRSRPPARASAPRRGRGASIRLFGARLPARKG